MAFEVVVTAVLCIELSVLIRMLIVDLAVPVRATRVPDDESHSTVANQLHILLPALREQNLVRSTLDAYENLISPFNNVEAVVVTTEKEQRESGAQTTAERVDEELEHRQGSLRRLHFTETDGNKASQVNYAIQQIVKDHESKDSYFAVYDFDARLERQALTEFNRVVSTANPDALQQIPLPIKNLQSLLDQGKYFSAVEGIQHCTRSIGIEKFRILVNRNISIIPYYLCGSGMYLRQSCFEKYGWLPEVDDVPYGYRLYLHGARVNMLDSENRVEVQDSVGAITNMNIFVFHGVIQFFSEIRRFLAQRTTPKALIRALLLLVCTLYEVFEMMFLPLFIVAALIVAWATSNAILLVLALGLALTPVLGALVSIGSIRRRGQLNVSSSAMICILALSPLRRVWRSVGPFRYVFRQTRSWFASSPVVYHKTER